MKNPSWETLKIGRSIDVDKRLSRLQTGNPNVLKTHKYIPTIDSKTLEANLHKVFQNRRKNGEWFLFESIEELDEEISKISSDNTLLLWLLTRIESLEKEIRELKDTRNLELRMLVCGQLNK